MQSIGVALLVVILQSASGLRTSNRRTSNRDSPAIEAEPAQEGAAAAAPAVKAKKIGPRSTKGATKISRQEKRPDAAELNDGAPVFFTVIMGRLAMRHQVSIWLSSLRLVGKWTGEAVIVTDYPACLGKTLTDAKLVGDLQHSDEDVDIYGPASGYTGNLHLVKRPVANTINKMKLEKTRAWKSVAKAQIPHKVSSIVYTDEDVIIATPINDFVSLIRGQENKNFTVACFKDTGVSKGQIHTGVIVMFPSVYTETCLHEWGNKMPHVPQSAKDESLAKVPPQVPPQAAKDEAQFMDQEAEEESESAEENPDSTVALSKVMGPDQKALGRTPACVSTAYVNPSTNQGSAGVAILPKQFFWLPTPGGVKAGYTAAFTHFTNTGRWRLISDNLIVNWLKNIGIPEKVDPMGKLNDADETKCASESGVSSKRVHNQPKTYRGKGSR